MFEGSWLAQCFNFIPLCNLQSIWTIQRKSCSIQVSSLGAFRPELRLPLRPKERHATKSHRLAKPVSTMWLPHSRTWKNRVKLYESVYEQKISKPRKSKPSELLGCFSSPETDLFFALIQASGWSTTLFPATLRNPCFSTMEPWYQAAITTPRCITMKWM